MKRHLHRTCELHKVADGFDIHGTIGPQQPEDDSNGTELLHMVYVFPHYRNFRLGVLEAAATRAKEDVNGKAAALDGCLDETVTWSKSTFAEA